jgi:hypothetical protein
MRLMISRTLNCLLGSLSLALYDVACEKGLNVSFESKGQM